VNKRGTGVIFCCISAFLYASYYISAAIFGSNVSSWSPELYGLMLDSIGNGLPVFAAISLIIGVIYLIAEFLGGKDNNEVKEVESINNNVDSSET